MSGEVRLWKSKIAEWWPYRNSGRWYLTKAQTRKWIRHSIKQYKLWRMKDA